MSKNEEKGKTDNHAQNWIKKQTQWLLLSRDVEITEKLG